MPQGNHHMTPPGLWYQTPKSSSIPRLMRWTCTKLALMFGSIYLFQQYRSLAYKYTYTDFIGKTMSLGNLTTLTHEPLSVEEIDRLKASKSKQ